MHSTHKAIDYRYYSVNDISFTFPSAIIRPRTLTVSVYQIRRREKKLTKLHLSCFGTYICVSPSITASSFLLFFLSLEQSSEHLGCVTSSLRVHFARFSYINIMNWNKLKTFRLWWYDDEMKYAAWMHDAWVWSWIEVCLKLVLRKIRAQRL